MPYKVLLEASGSLTSNYLLQAVKESGAKSVSSDVVECAAATSADEFVIFPYSSDKNLWYRIDEEIKYRNINVVIPSLDETLLDWAKKKQYFLNCGVHIIISNSEVIQLCQDKWETYNSFKKHGIPCPESSLDNIYPLVKPREGRGGKGIIINGEKNMSMEGMMSQELIKGVEYTIDVFCDINNHPIYIIPRKRLNVKDGKSLNGITVRHSEIIKWVEKICKHLQFIGPVNMQCFEQENGDIKFIEINPRIAGGMALGFAASENWVNLIIQNIVEQKPVQPKEVKYGLKMFRFYDEVFVS